MVASFVASSLAVSQNAVKSILFRAAGLALQLGVFRLFALLASAKGAFTSYLMFTEDYIQRALFVISRGFTHHAALVIFFTICLLGSGLYDTLLWGLDSPGYIQHKQNVTASTVKNQLLKRPSYVVFSSTKPEDIDTADFHVMDSLNNNLFQSNLNFSLTGHVSLGTPESIPPTRDFDPINNVGPRIWLDEEGFSVSPDSYATVSAEGDGYSCPWVAGAKDKTASWQCSFDNIHALAFLRGQIGMPEIHWDDITDKNFLSEYLRPNREDNPWTFLGAGGETAMMKQMFTVTKERRRHTFLSSAMKITSVYNHKMPFPKDSVHDLVKRSWSPDHSQWNDPRIGKITDSIETGVGANKSFHMGSIVKAGNSVAQLNYEYLNVLANDMVAYSAFRISLVNITLVRSETLPNPVKPLEPCDHYYHNQASGGKVYGTNCYEPLSSQNNTGARFFGELDSSSVLVIGGILGDGSTNVSSKAFNQNGYEWIAKNEEMLDNLVLSRGYIMAIDPSLVDLETSSVQPAMSPLQVMLVILPIVFCAVIWGLLWCLAPAHYASSLLANLYATTNIGNTDTSTNPAYIYHMPDINLVKKDGIMQIATATGVFTHSESDAMEYVNIGGTNENSRGSYVPVQKS